MGKKRKREKHLQVMRKAIQCDTAENKEKTGKTVQKNLNKLGMVFFYGGGGKRWLRLHTKCIKIT